MEEELDTDFQFENSKVKLAFPLSPLGNHAKEEWETEMQTRIHMQP